MNVLPLPRGRRFAPADRHGTRAAPRQGTPRCLDVDRNDRRRRTRRPSPAACARLADAPPVATMRSTACALTRREWLAIAIICPSTTARTLRPGHRRYRGRAPNAGVPHVRRDLGLEPRQHHARRCCRAACCAAARENAAQSRPCSEAHRTRGRASRCESRRGSCSRPIGEPNTWRASAVGRGSCVHAEDACRSCPATRRARLPRTMPVPTRLLGLSPDHVTTGGRKRVAVAPVRRERAGDRPRRANRRKPAPADRARWRRAPPVTSRHVREVHQVHAGAVARIDRRVAAREERRQVRADQVNAHRCRRRRRGRSSKNLRICGPVKRSYAPIRSARQRPRVRRAPARSPRTAPRALVHPDRRLRRARTMPAAAARAAARGSSCRQTARASALQVDAAVLLRGAGDARGCASMSTSALIGKSRPSCDRARRPTSRGDDVHFARCSPPPARRRSCRIREVAVEVQRVLEDDPPLVAVQSR